MESRSEVLFIGGRSGVGKTTVAYEIHAQLSVREVRHALIEGDNLDMAYPPTREDRLAERNLAAMWGNYRSLGFRRAIYVNTASVRVVDELTDAMGDRPRVTAVLMAAELDETARPWVHRIATDGRTVTDIAAEVVTLTGWAAAA